MELFPYQKEAIEFVAKNKKVYLAMGLGTGKTITSLASAHRLAKKNILVVAELNEIANSQNFKREVETHFPDLNYINLRTGGLPSSEKGAVCGINPDALFKFSPEELAKSFDFIIIDEATMAKNVTTKRFKSLKKICRGMDYVVLLSGTPMMNGASEIYAPLLLLDHPLASTGTVEKRRSFEEIFAGGCQIRIRRTGIAWKDYIWIAKDTTNVRVLRRLVSDKFFFIRKEDTGIFKNKKTRTTKYLPMSLDWLAEYNQAWDNYLIEAGKRDVDIDNVLELQQLIKNGQCYQVNSKYKAEQVVKDIMAGVYGQQRIIVFSLFIETQNIIEEALKRNKITYRLFDEVSEWKDGNEQVLVGRIKAHGKGGNLPEASVVIFVDMDFVPASNIQAENRIDRPEQQKDMTIIYYLTEGNEIVDEHIRKINQNKSRRIDEFMKPLSDEELRTWEGDIEALVRRYARAFKLLDYDWRSYSI